MQPSIAVEKRRQDRESTPHGRVGEGAIVIDDDVKGMWRGALRYSAVGMEVGIAIAIGYGVGSWLDEK